MISARSNQGHPCKTSDYGLRHKIKAIPMLKHFTQRKQAFTAIFLKFSMFIWGFKSPCSYCGAAFPSSLWLIPYLPCLMAEPKLSFTMKP